MAAFLARDEVVVERLTKAGIRAFDARDAVVSLAVDAPATGTRRAARVGEPGRVRYCDWSCITGHRLFDPTMC